MAEPQHARQWQHVGRAVLQQGHVRSGVDMAELELLTERIQAKFGSVYHAGCSSCVLYRGGGTLSDWVYEELGVNRWEDVTSLVFLSPPQVLRPRAEGAG